MFRLRHYGRVLAVVAAAALALSGQAHHIAPYSIDQMARAADSIAHGTIVSLTCLKDSKGRVYTRAELEVRSLWKGSLPSDSRSLDIVYPGGVLGERRVKMSPGLEFKIQEETVVFLLMNARGDGVVIGLNQGKFSIQRPSSASQALAFNDTFGAPLAADGAFPPHRPPLTLKTLRDQAVAALE